MSKRAAEAQSSDGSVPRSKKKSKPTFKFRLANDPAVEPIRATTIRQRSHGRLGYQKMDSVRVTEPPKVSKDTSEVEGSFDAEHETPDYGHDIEGANAANVAVTPKKKINTTSVSEFQ
jgi:hypothetical protein